MFGVLVSITSTDCIQRVIQCVQGPPELLWLCHAGCQLLDTMWPMVLTTDSEIKYLAAVIVFFSCTFYFVSWCMFGHRNGSSTSTLGAAVCGGQRG